jgi:hypothetical protein
MWLPSNELSKAGDITDAELIVGLSFWRKITK